MALTMHRWHWWPVLHRSANALMWTINMRQTIPKRYPRRVYVNFRFAKRAFCPLFSRETTTANNLPQRRWLQPCHSNVLITILQAIPNCWYVNKFTCTCTNKSSNSVLFICIARVRQYLLMLSNEGYLKKSLLFVPTWTIYVLCKILKNEYGFIYTHIRSYLLPNTHCAMLKNGTIADFFYLS